MSIFLSPNLAVKAVLESRSCFVPIGQIGNFQIEVDVAAPLQVVYARAEQPDDEPFSPNASRVHLAIACACSCDNRIVTSLR